LTGILYASQLERDGAWTLSADACYRRIMKTHMKPAELAHCSHFHGMNASAEPTVNLNLPDAARVSLALCLLTGKPAWWQGWAIQLSLRSSCRQCCCWCQVWSPHRNKQITAKYSVRRVCINHKYLCEARMPQVVGDVARRGRRTPVLPTTDDDDDDCIASPEDSMVLKAASPPFK
jgi:hypothetical protein